LQVLGKCLDVNAAGTANGTTVDLYDCNGTGAQVWVPQSNGELLNTTPANASTTAATAAPAPRSRSGPAPTPPTSNWKIP